MLVKVPREADGLWWPSSDPDPAAAETFATPVLPNEASCGALYRWGVLPPTSSPALRSGVEIEDPLLIHHPYRVFFPNVGLGRYKGLWVPHPHRWQWFKLWALTTEQAYPAGLLGNGGYGPAFEGDYRSDLWAIRPAFQETYAKPLSTDQVGQAEGATLAHYQWGHPYYEDGWPLRRPFSSGLTNPLEGVGEGPLAERGAPFAESTPPCLPETPNGVWGEKPQTLSGPGPWRFEWPHTFPYQLTAGCHPAEFPYTPTANSRRTLQKGAREVDPHDHLPHVFEEALLEDPEVHDCHEQPLEGGVRPPLRWSPEGVPKHEVRRVGRQRGPSGRAWHDPQGWVEGRDVEMVPLPPARHSATRVPEAGQSFSPDLRYLSHPPRGGAGGHALLANRRPTTRDYIPVK